MHVAGKFPTPVSHSEDLATKITEVRSTIKFQLKKVLCLGVAVGHVEMTDDQVLANVMLSESRHITIYIGTWQLTEIRYQLPGFLVEKELAKCQVSSH
jgi:large subunit ribosomal protein L10Ae